MTGRLTCILLPLLLLGFLPCAHAADGATAPDLKRLDTVVRDSGLLAEVFDSFPDAVARCSSTSTPGVFRVEYLSNQKVVGWARVTNDSVLTAAKGAPPRETTPVPSPSPAAPTGATSGLPDEANTIPPEAVPTTPLQPSQVQPAPRDLFWWLNELLPRYRETALLCLAVLITVLVAFDLGTFLKARNFDLLSLFIVATASLEVFLNYGSPHNSIRLAAWSVIFVTTIWLLIRCLSLGYTKVPRPPFGPNLPTTALVVLLVLVGLVHLERLLRQDVGASGIWSVRGAQHILSRGELPYGKLGPGDAYGPVVYLVEIPAVLAFPPAYVDSHTGLTMPWNPATSVQKVRIAHLKRQMLDIAAGKKVEADPAALRDELVQLENSINQLPPARAFVLTPARVTAAVLDALIILGIIIIGMRYTNLKVGLAAAIIYALLPYTVDRLAHVGSLVPIAFTVWAVVFLGSPLVAGFLLALGAAAAFFPAFLFPLWLSYYAHREGALRFFLAFALVAVVSILGLWLLTDNWTADQLRDYLSSQVASQLEKTDAALRTAPPDSDQARSLEALKQKLSEQLNSLRRPYFSLSFVLSRILSSQETGASSDSALFSFWGQLQAVGFPLTAVRSVLMLLSFMFYVALFFLPGRKEPLSLIALSAAVLISTQLWKPVAGGLATWYAPLLVLSFLLYEGVRKELPPEKFVPLQDMRPSEPPVSPVEEIDALIARQGRMGTPRR